MVCDTRLNIIQLVSCPLIHAVVEARCGRRVVRRPPAERKPTTQARADLLVGSIRLADSTPKCTSVQTVLPNQADAVVTFPSGYPVLCQVGRVGLFESENMGLVAVSHEAHWNDTLRRG